MSEYDIHNNIKPQVALNINTVNSDTTTIGEIIDTKGFESIEFVVASGTVTDGLFNFVLEEGDDAGLSDATVLDSSQILGALLEFTSAADNTTFRVGSIGKDRFQRLSMISTGTSLGGLFSAIAILGNPHTGPTENLTSIP